MIAIAFGTINVVGGFLVTDRMLGMFKAKPDPQKLAAKAEAEEREGRRVSRADVIQLLYIVAFSLFIIGLHMLRGPRTAVRGNLVAAVGHGDRRRRDADRRAHRRLRSDRARRGRSGPRSGSPRRAR